MVNGTEPYIIRLLQFLFHAIQEPFDYFLMASHSGDVKDRDSIPIPGWCINDDPILLADADKKKRLRRNTDLQVLKGVKGAENLYEPHYYRNMRLFTVTKRAKKAWFRDFITVPGKSCLQSFYNKFVCLLMIGLGYLKFLARFRFIWCCWRCTDC